MVLTMTFSAVYMAALKQFNRCDDANHAYMALHANKIAPPDFAKSNLLGH